MRINSDEIHIVIHIDFWQYHYTFYIYPQKVALIKKRPVRYLV
jgi:hypothetical protein